MRTEDNWLRKKRSFLKLEAEVIKEMLDGYETYPEYLVLRLAIVLKMMDKITLELEILRKTEGPDKKHPIIEFESEPNKPGPCLDHIYKKEKNE